MDRKVIVLTPDEWDQRINLGEALQCVENHTHYAITRNHNIDTALHGILNGLENGNPQDVQEHILAAMAIVKQSTEEINNARHYVFNISLLIRMTLEKERKVLT